MGTVYKGTLSTGVEIAVTSLAVESAKEWPENLEAQFRKKIYQLSRVNHKNFVNLIGYCEEDKPFTRMVVFEYAPNGTLFEHLHIFSNILNNTQLHIVADSDEHEAVHQVQEFYVDFVAGDPFHFTLNIPANYIYMLPAVVDHSNLHHFCDRVVDGLAAIFLALKRQPVIRYSRTSDVAKRIAQDLGVREEIRLK